MGEKAYLYRKEGRGLCGGEGKRNGNSLSVYNLGIEKGSRRRSRIIGGAWIEKNINTMGDRCREKDMRENRRPLGNLFPLCNPHPPILSSFSPTRTIPSALSL